MQSEIKHSKALAKSDCAIVTQTEKNLESPQQQHTLARKHRAGPVPSLRMDRVQPEAHQKDIMVVDALVVFAGGRAVVS